MKKAPKKCTFQGCEQTSAEHDLVIIRRTFGTGNIAVHIESHWKTQGGEWWGSKSHVYHLRAHDRPAYRRARNYARKKAEALGCKIIDEYGAFGLNVLRPV